MTVEEFEKFLEKKHIDIYISHRMDVGILTGKFYISDDNILAIYEVKSGFHSIYQMEHDVLLDLFISLLAKKENLKDVHDAIVSALAGDKCVTNKVESPDDSKDTKMYIDDILKKKDNSAGPIITGGIEMPSIREQTLDEAKKCIMGNREQDYGTPESNFTTIASFWSDYLGMNISAQQVADMMILMKISRIKNGGGTGDSYVDIAGYAACGNEILSKKG